MILMFHLLERSLLRGWCDDTNRFYCKGYWCCLFSLLSKVSNEAYKVLICGGGRKNKVLLEKIKKNTLQNIILQPIDDYGIDGDFVESQAFAFLAIRSVLKLPISFPETTGFNKPNPGGVFIKY